MGFSGVISTTSPKSSAYDVSARGFFIAQSDAGVTLTDTQKNATNQLVIDLKAAGLWNKMKAVYPMVGGTATSHKFNLITPADTDAAFRLTFAGGITHSSTGMTGNGTNGYANTQFNPSVSSTLNNTHISFYSRTNNDTTAIDIGNSNGSGGQWLMCLRFTGVGTISDQYNSTTGRITTTQSDSRGFFIGSRTTSAIHKAFKNGTQIGSTNTGASGSFQNLNITLLAANQNNIPVSYSTKECSFASIGDGLTDLEAQLFYQITEKYQVALGRNINPTQSFYYNSAYNNETNAFLFSTQITDATIQTATNTLVSDLKTANIWTKMKAVYPMVGGTATTHKFNLVNPQDTNAAFRLNFVGGWTHSANGALPNGTNAYADTFITPSTHLLLNSAHLSFYSRTNSTGNFADMGVANNSSSFSAIQILSKWSDNKFYAQVNDYDFTDNTVADSLGFFCGSRTASNVQKNFKNGSIVTSKTAASTLLVGYSIPIGARYIQNVAGSPGYTSYSNRQSAFASIGDGLTDAEALSFYNAVQTFQTTLGRQV